MRRNCGEWGRPPLILVNRSPTLHLQTSHSMWHTAGYAGHPFGQGSHWSSGLQKGGWVLGLTLKNSLILLTCSLSWAQIGSQKTHISNGISPARCAMQHWHIKHGQGFTATDTMFIKGHFKDMASPWDHVQAQSAGLYAPQVSPVNTVSGQVFVVLNVSAQLYSKEVTGQ